MAAESGTPENRPPWQWEEPRWRSIVGKVRAGRSLKPVAWKDGARVAVALSFDSDHESLTLRSGETSPGKLSQGEYGSRAAMPRILSMLARCDVPATFFVPAVIAMLYPEEQREVAGAGHEIGIHGWIHEFNSRLPRKANAIFRCAPRIPWSVSPECARSGCAHRPGISVRTPSRSAARWDSSTTPR